MKHCWFIVLLVLPFLAMAQKTAPPQRFAETINSSSAGFSAERLNKIDQWVQQFIDSGNVPNAVIFVAQKGNVVYHKAFGFTNIEKRRKAEITDIFRIASQTKAIASVALMTFFEEG